MCGHRLYQQNVERCCLQISIPYKLEFYGKTWGEAGYPDFRSEKYGHPQSQQTSRSLHQSRCQQTLEQHCFQHQVRFGRVWHYFVRLCLHELPRNFPSSI